ncbi:nuclear transport factor 2 family protein [Pseudonocardia sp. RS010]|uniref:oxidoreductase n=1 Tax=Pseudonocardia sp. RS010 TaxID=3385979 RepID=UPI0039A0B65B
MGSTTSSGRLFEELRLRDVRIRNRTTVSPMCQYSALDGVANDYHLVHLGRFALGGFGLVMTEAVAISPEGRLTYGDLGLWREDQVVPIARIGDFVHAHGAAFGIQLGHAGSKASTLPPWATEEDRPADGLWQPRSVTDQPYEPGWLEPRQLNHEELEAQVGDWRAATRRAAATGADVLEIHMAHGYLLHAFLSPLTNTRTDEYGGDLEARLRFPLRVARAVREEWPQDRPLFVRLSVYDNGHDGIDMEQTVEVASRLRELGVDVVDCSSGGVGGRYVHGIRPGYQIDWASEVRRRAGVHTVAVGLITDAEQADEVVRAGHADLVAVGRESLVDPSWPVRAREQLAQYEGADRFDLLPVQARSWIAKRQRQLDRLAAAAADAATDPAVEPEPETLSEAGSAAAVAELSDRAQIMELGAKYCRGIDHGDLDLFLSIWHSEGEYVVGRQKGRFHGAAELTRALEFVRRAYAQTHHWVTNHIIERLDAGHAQATSDSFAVCVDTDGRPALVSATYEDLYVRVGVTWKLRRRIVRRRFVSDPMDLGLLQPAAPDA